MFEHKLQVTLTPDTHQYFDQHNREYTSVSKLFKRFEAIVDWEGIKKNMARAKGTTVEAITADWSAKAKSSQVKGTRIHNALERYDKQCLVIPEDEELKVPIKSINQYFNGYKQTFPEKIIFSEEYGVAGTSDKLAIQAKNNIVDIWDYKTNEAKGIEYGNKYGQFLQAPLDHLHACNYIEYFLKLSVYGLLIETTWKYKIGRLALIFIPLDNPMNHFMIPGPYMRNEAWQMLQIFKQEKINQN